MNRVIVIIALFISTLSAFGQDIYTADNIPTKIKIEADNIDGAPLLKKAKLINGTNEFIQIDKFGAAYPTLFDFNQDGIKDLVVGEFKSGKKGSNIRIYKNIGTNKRPKYTGEFTYAKDINGDTISIHTW